jgi:recombination protein RecR
MTGIFMTHADLQTLIKLLAKIPGLGPRSGRRAALHLLKNRETALLPLLESMGKVAETIQTCQTCGNLDTSQPCTICHDQSRDRRQLCVVEDVADLWALERTASFRGLYHVLGGTLSALGGIGPDELKIPKLLDRLRQDHVQEVIIALNATVEGQTTAYYLHDRLHPFGVKVSALAHGVPVGGELDYLDDGTLSMALNARKEL